MNIPSNLKGKELWDFLAKHKDKIIKSRLEGMKISDPTRTTIPQPIKQQSNEN